MSSWTAASSDCSRPVNNYVHVKTADLYRPNARLTQERQGYQVLTPFGKLGHSQFVRTRIDSRVAELNKSAEAQRKNTPPLIDVRLGNSSSTGEILLEIQAKNEIPFTARWSVLTTRNEFVSGILIEDFEAHPTKERSLFLVKVPIQGEKVRENYIELHFTFTSRYSTELNNPQKLKGEIVKKYRYFNGRISPMVE